MPVDIFLLVVAVAAIVCSVLALLRARRTDRQLASKDLGTRAAVLQPFLNRRGRRYYWYLLIVSSCLALVIARNLVLHEG